MRNDKHIDFDIDVLNKLNDYCKMNKLSYKKAVNQLLTQAFQIEESTISLSKVHSDINYLKKKLYICLELIKQIYSDFEFENITEPNKNIFLNEILKNIRTDKIDD